ncbi:helix-turn-helix transcriptional regulator [Candidatus Saccharibacteria bacterium]|nr:helix-turn-helix transcriptional regulator [Candidatus Saccharibacteria bacterium]
MDLRKIGKFIAKKRQEKGFTQESLAEELGISNRSISKWERGICLPDAGNMTKLCKVLNVNYNELLSGEKLNQEDYEKKAEENLKEFTRIETAQNKKLFLYENVIGYMSAVSFIILVFVASFAEMPILARIILLSLGFILLIVGVSFCLKIETETGKYKCKYCGYLHVPKYSTVYFAMHLGRTRYMTCPKCHKKSWQKKVI